MEGSCCTYLSIVDEMFVMHISRKDSTIFSIMVVDHWFSTRAEYRASRPWWVYQSSCGSLQHIMENDSWCEGTLCHYHIWDGEKRRTSSNFSKWTLMCAADGIASNQIYNLCVFSFAWDTVVSVCKQPIIE